MSTTYNKNEIGDDAWGYKFKIPDGWKYRKETTGVILGHDTIAGMILVIPHREVNFINLQQRMIAGFAEPGMQLILVSRLQMIGDTSIAGEYMGVFSGQQVKARVIGTVSPNGGGAYIYAITSPDKFSSKLSSPADLIADGIQYFSLNYSSDIEDSDIMNNFAGTWVGFTKNSQTKITLAPDGSYYENYESSYSGQFYDSGGYQTGGWGTANQNQDRGRWTIKGNREKGIILFMLPDGRQSPVPYQVHVEKGRPYWNEYFFNGNLYQKQR